MKDLLWRIAAALYEKQGCPETEPFNYVNGVSRGWYYEQAEIAVQAIQASGTHRVTPVAKKKPIPKRGKRKLL